MAREEAPGGFCQAISILKPESFKDKFIPGKFNKVKNGLFKGHLINKKTINVISTDRFELYGRVLLSIFYHSPPMKIYYFSKYQYHNRIKPFLKKRKGGITFK